MNSMENNKSNLGQKKNYVRLIICRRCIRQVHLMDNYEIITLPAGENIRNAIEEIMLSQMVHI